MTDPLYLTVEQIRGTHKTWSAAYVHKLASKGKWRRIKVNHQVRYRAEDVATYLARVSK